MARPNEPRPYPKADLLHRAVGRFVDLVIAVLLGRLLPEVGSAVAIAYLLLGDGLLEGQSLGKKLAGLRVMNLKTRRPAGYRESALRNFPFALVAFFYVIPIIGWLLFPLGGLFIFAFEAYMTVTDRHGFRIGDVFADTQVVDASVPLESPQLTEGRRFERVEDAARAKADPEPA